jgi:D-alanyl-lipoteichoic acid acyltransferase DltB (MBOAT superfamily)
MEFIKFVFSSFWIWLGTFMLLALVLQAVLNICKLLIERKKVNNQSKNSNANSERQKEE